MIVKSTWENVMEDKMCGMDWWHSMTKEMEEEYPNLECICKQFQRWNENKGILLQKNKGRMETKAYKFLSFRKYT